MECTMTSSWIRGAFQTPVDDEEIGIPLTEPGEPVKVPDREEEEILTPA